MIAAPVFVPLKHRQRLKTRQWQQQRLVYQVADAGSWVPTRLPPGSAFTIRRDAGLGDCLMIACAIAALKQQRPDLRISFAMPRGYTELLSRFEGIDRALGLEDGVVADQPLIELSNYAERHPQGNKLDRTTLFAQALGVRADKVPTYRPSSADMRTAEESLHGQRPIAICVRGKYPHRSWLIPRALQLAARLLDEGLDVILFDAEQQPPYADWIDDMAGTHAKGVGAASRLSSTDSAWQPKPRDSISKPVRQASRLPGFNGTGHLLRAFGMPLHTVAATLSRCWAAVTPDTGFLHLCGCLQVPFVGIFGAIAPQLRTALYENHVDLIAAGVPCAPCFESEKHIACKLQCLQAVDVEMVYQALREVSGRCAWVAATSQP